MKKWFLTYIKSIRKDLLILLAFDVVFLLIMELWLKRIPAPTPAFVVLGDILVTLGISFIASFIFYFVQVHMPETKQKDDLYPSIAALLSRILLTEKSLLTNFVGGESFEMLSEDLIITGAKARDVNKQNAPLIFAGLERHANWMEYGFNSVEDIDKSWEMVMKYSSYLESECLSLLSRIQSDTILGFYRTMRGIYRSLKNGLNIQGMENEYVKFWYFIQEQESYFNRVFAVYKQ